MTSFPTDQVPATLARQTWRLTEPLHAMIYFAEEPARRYAELGLPGSPYFASRSAALGTPSADVVVATFYNFSPRVVHPAIPAAWDVASPKVVLAARLAGADEALRRVLGAAVDGPEIAEAADLAARAARAAT